MLPELLSLTLSKHSTGSRNTINRNYVIVKRICPLQYAPPTSLAHLSPIRARASQ
jgi:hypothetical protein